jgi:hypothetical protein
MPCFVKTGAGIRTTPESMFRVVLVSVEGAVIHEDLYLASLNPLGIAGILGDNAHRPASLGAAEFAGIAPFLRIGIPRDSLFPPVVL